MAKWLQQWDWSFWETLTHMHDVTPRACRRAVTKYLRAHAPDRAIWVVEHGRIGGKTHAHALTYYAQRVPDPSDLFHWWHARYGRARIAPHDPEKGASRYILKSMAGAREDHMRRGVDWDIYSPQPIKKEDEELWTEQRCLTGK